jgi:hypothetical protein
MVAAHMLTHLFTRTASADIYWRVALPLDLNLKFDVSVDPLDLIRARNALQTELSSKPDRRATSYLEKITTAMGLVRCTRFAWN